MSYDLYIYIEKPDGDAATQIRLLVTPQKDTLSEYIRLVHGQTDRETKQLQRAAFNRLIEGELNRMQKLGIEAPTVGGYFRCLPSGSWFLQFAFTLAKPWISKDDAPFYVADSVNPLRKDKVFKVPFMSAATWKGLLRWTAMHKRLVLRKDLLSDEDFASERFRHSLLFGDEKGEELGGAKDFAAFLDGLKQEARGKYRSMVKEYFGTAPGKNGMPRHRGRLTFYPSFFDAIDVEVINPHSRKTKAGKHPIYLECVPADAIGTFSLLYVPFDLIGRQEDEIRLEAKKDLELIAEAISSMMLIYGFSAKRTSGYGAAQDKIDGFVHTRQGKKELASIASLVKEVRNVGF